MKTILITGGCGFIGCNTANILRRRGHRISVLDNLSRGGAKKNLSWLQLHGQVDFINADIRDQKALNTWVHSRQPDILIHLAAQVAVTTSVLDPRVDFETNAIGTFNVLEAVRKYSPATLVLNASTNKVYGKLENFHLVERKTRWEIADIPDGVDEAQPLDLHSPYGCSKGAADQYVADYFRIYGVRTVNFRQSCIYGSRQFGVEDQGWVAWFLIAHALGVPITIYGDGKQVRDVLHVEDLVECYSAAFERADEVAGETFNIGGGSLNTLSLIEFMNLLRSLSDVPINLAFSDSRIGDQPVYVSNICKAKAKLGWEPKIRTAEGISQLHRWVRENISLFARAEATGT